MIQPMMPPLSSGGGVEGRPVPNGPPCANAVSTAPMASRMHTATIASEVRSPALRPKDERVLDIEPRPLIASLRDPPIDGVAVPLRFMNGCSCPQYSNIARAVASGAADQAMGGARVWNRTYRDASGSTSRLCVSGSRQITFGGVSHGSWGGSNASVRSTLAATVDSSDPGSPGA